MKASWKSLWTISELEELSARALSVLGGPAVNGRVRAVPDQRTIRYYTTLGLIDRPAAMQGRTALYGRRHLLQLVAIKRLQARGLSLAELQRQLVGLPDASLADIARLPANLEEESAGAMPPPAPRPGPFWKQAPATLPESVAEDDESDVPRETAQPLQGVPLADDLLLLLAADRPMTPEDVEALRTAAAPLRQLLEQRRLWHPRRERKAP